MKFYRDKNTRMIHRVGEFPSPRREGHAHCGRPLDKCVKIPRYEALRSPDHEFCIKCYQLAGNQ